jgi:hypothetical protein
MTSVLPLRNTWARYLNVWGAVHDQPVSGVIGPGLLVVAAAPSWPALPSPRHLTHIMTHLTHLPFNIVFFWGEGGCPQCLTISSRSTCFYLKTQKKSKKENIEYKDSCHLNFFPFFTGQLQVVTCSLHKLNCPWLIITKRNVHHAVLQQN